MESIYAKLLLHMLTPTSLKYEPLYQMAVGHDDVEPTKSEATLMTMKQNLEDEPLLAGFSEWTNVVFHLKHQSRLQLGDERKFRRHIIRCSLGGIGCMLAKLCVPLV